MLETIETERIPFDVIDRKKELLCYQCIKTISIRSTNVGNNRAQRRYPIGIIIKYWNKEKTKLIKQSLVMPKDSGNTMKHVVLELEPEEHVNFIEGRLNRGTITYLLLATNQGKYIE